LSAVFDIAAVLFCVRALLRGVADATCVGLSFALAAFGFAVAFGVVAAPVLGAGALLSIDVLPLAVADLLLSIDALPLAVADLLLSIDALPLVVADELLSVDVLPLALLDVLALVDAAGVLVPADALVPALAVLFLRHSLNASPSLPMHGADEVEEAGGGVVAVLVADGVYVDCAPTTLAAANAVARSRARGLNTDWFIKTSYR